MDWHDPQHTPHELNVWVDQTTAEMASEYQRIRARATEDPGTAGDEGEEGWAKLLREWLPSNYEIRTKGRILSHDGTASRQVDLVVLRPGYPRRMLDKKLYLASGVAAAFECKLTLKRQHIIEAVETSAQLARMQPARTGTPYKELVSPCLYGILAQSHSWSCDGVAYSKVREAHVEHSRTHVRHAREHLDVVCVADGWTQLRSLDLHKFPTPPDREELLLSAGDYLACNPPAPVAALIAYLLIRLGWEDPQVRPLADYFRLAGMLHSSSGGASISRPTELTVETEREALARCVSMLGGRPAWSWDEWSFSLD